MPPGKAIITLETSSAFSDERENRRVARRPPFLMLRAIVATRLLFAEARIVALPLMIYTLLRPPGHSGVL